jgi:hypothetical protein
MSEEAQKQIDALNERVSKLEELIASQVIVRFDDVQDEHRILSQRMNQYQAAVDQRVTELTDRATRELYETPLDQIRETYGRLLDQFKSEIRKIASEEFVRGLTKKVLVTRTASQADLKEGVPVVVVRHATHREATTGVVAE